MIPKTIHYCWFGCNLLPESAVKCINSWRKFFPDYEIKEWNEDNFDVNCIPYTAEAYQAHKYAFVSDYARFWILYHYGGVYFDTDVEVIKPMDDIIERGPFLGMENVWTYPTVAPGLGMAAEEGHVVYKQALDCYANMHFIHHNRIAEHESIVPLTTRLLKEAGMQPDGELQQVAGIWIYPVDFFNPLDDLTGRLKVTNNTRSIHWYSASWQNHNQLLRWIKRRFHRMVGSKMHQIHRIKKGFIKHILGRH
jgi:mannosyltransferase OCH1-like enzyme